MKVFQRILISPDEPRLRSGWRLLGFFLLMFLALFVVGSLFIGVSVLVDSSVGAPVLAFLRDDSLISLVAITASVYLARRWYDRRSFASLGLVRNRAANLDLLVGIFIPGRHHRPDGLEALLRRGADGLSDLANDI